MISGGGGGGECVDLGNGYHAYKVWHIERNREGGDDKSKLRSLSCTWFPQYEQRHILGFPKAHEQRCPEIWAGNIVFVIENENEPSILMGEYHQAADQYGQGQELYGLIIAGCNGHYERMGQHSQYIHNYGHMSVLEAANKTLERDTGIPVESCIKSVPLGWYDDPEGDTRSHGIRFTVLRWIRNYNPKGTDCLNSLIAIRISELKDMCKNKSKLQINEYTVLPIILNYDNYIMNILSLPMTKEFVNTLITKEKVVRKRHKCK